jgi:hypothetical protein
MFRGCRDAPLAGGGAVKIRLTKKLAESIDGVDLERRRVGDVFEISDSEARLLVAEQWAVWEDLPGESPPLSVETKSSKPL